MSAPKRAREASIHAGHAENSARAQSLNKNSDRVKNRSRTRNTVSATAHVPEPISYLIDRRAMDWKTSRSKATLKLIELGLASDILEATGKVLADRMCETISKECRHFFNRITSILFQMFITLCQILHLQKHLLARSGYQRPPTPEQLDRVIGLSRTLAYDDVVRKTTTTGSALDTAIADYLAEEDHSQRKQRKEEEDEPRSS